MPWFPVDDEFAFSKKARKAGNAAVGLWVRAGAYCMKEATDGVVQRHELEGLGTLGQAKKLVEAGLWHAPGHRCRKGCPQPPAGGWVFHDWADWGPLKSADQITAKRDADRDRQRRKRARDRGGHADGHGVTPPVSHGNGHGDSHAAGHGGGRRSPSPYPSVSSSSNQSPPATRTGLTDEDMTKIQLRLRCDRDHAARVAEHVLSKAGAEVANPRAYVLAAIDKDPAQYRPSKQPPKSSDLCPVDDHMDPAGDCRRCRMPKAVDEVEPEEEAS